MKNKSIDDLLLNLANVSREDVERGEQREQFVDIMCALLIVQRGKAAHYGDYVKAIQEDNCPRLMQVMQIHAELKRKWKRLDEMAKRECYGDTRPSVAELLETLMDISIYAAMGMDIILEQDKQDHADHVNLSR